MGRILVSDNVSLDGVFQDPGRCPAAHTLRRVMLDWRFYHDMRSDRDSPLRQPCLAVTTPNAEYNALFPTLPAGAFRHPDHRFEWTRNEFRDWVTAIGQRYEYKVQGFVLWHW